MASRKLTHVDKEGRARMVDVTEKNQTVRVARAEAFVEMSAETWQTQPMMLSGIDLALVVGSAPSELDQPTRSKPLR